MVMDMDPEEISLEIERDARRYPVTFPKGVR